MKTGCYQPHIQFECSKFKSRDIFLVLISWNGKKIHTCSSAIEETLQQELQLQKIANTFNKYKNKTHTKNKILSGNQNISLLVTNYIVVMG